MTLRRQWPKWRDAERLDLWVPAGTHHRRVFIAHGPEFALGADFFTFPLDLDDFVTGQSEWDSPSDEAYCPCGEVLPDVGSSVGDTLRAIYKHCGAAGHPIPRFDR
jgi:hypothetical protein